MVEFDFVIKAQVSFKIRAESVDSVLKERDRLESVLRDTVAGEGGKLQTLAIRFGHRKKGYTPA